MPEVNCTVCNCEFWSQGNLCGASSILITAGGMQGKDPMGDNAALLSGTPVGQNQESFCRTFRARQEAFIEDEEEIGDEVEANVAMPPRI